MKFTKLTLGVVAATVALSASATDLQLTAAFKTIKDATVSQVAGHEMVINGLNMSATNSCIVATPTTAANWAGDTNMLMSSTGSLAAMPTYGATTGTGCTAGKSTPGIYEIDGSPGANVTVSVVTGAQAGLTFVPSGCVGNYDDAADGDTCSAVSNGSNATVKLATSKDEVVSAGNGQPVAGKSRIVLGGQVTTAIGLTAATTYTIPFEISVTY